MADTLTINEIYLSIQGESSLAGWPCIFVRLTACNLRCSYCDTAYAFTEGRPISLPDIRRMIDEIARPYRRADRAGEQRLPFVELTGGEPLLQEKSHQLMRELCDAGYSVLVETSGALDISKVDARVKRIVDIKCPSSGEAQRNLWENLAHLRATDELKFVIGTMQDYEFAKTELAQRRLSEICPVLFSWVSPLHPQQQDRTLKKIPEDHVPISRKELVERTLKDFLPVRFQLQMHKFIWPPEQKGV